MQTAKAKENKPSWLRILHIRWLNDLKAAVEIMSPEQKAEVRAVVLKATRKKK